MPSPSCIRALEASYPNQESAGALVAYKLAWAVAEQFSSGQRLDTKLRQFMLNATSLAAIGTVADVVDLRGENRVLTRFGLQALPESKLCGLRALIQSTGLAGQGVDSYRHRFSAWRRCSTPPVGWDTRAWPSSC